MFGSELAEQPTCSTANFSIFELAHDYATLFVLPTLTPLQERRFAEILAVASQDKELDRILSQVEGWCGLQLGLLDAEHRHSYENQKAFLREYLGTDIAECSTH